MPKRKQFAVDMPGTVTLLTATDPRAPFLLSPPMWDAGYRFESWSYAGYHYARLRFPNGEKSRLAWMQVGPHWVANEA